MNIPNHVAIILDGNGRWAKAKGMPRNYGHVQGAKTVEQICEDAWNLGIHYLTVYAFSTENWNRPKDEVSALMTLLRNYMKSCLKRATQNNMCVRVIGDKTGLDDDIRKRIAELEEATKDNTGLHFQIAINYGGRDEIRRAVTNLAEQVQAGNHQGKDQCCTGYGRDPRARSFDPHLQRASDFQFPVVAAGLHRVLFYTGGVARFFKGRAGKGD